LFQREKLKDVVIKNLEGESDGLEADLVRLRQSGGGD